MNKEFLKNLEKKAREDHIPIVSWPVAELLNFLVGINKAKRVLEIGTAVGYSTIWLTGDTVEKITTVEIDLERQNQARENVSEAGLLEKVDFILGDASEVLPNLQERYDFIFLDSAKGQYVRLLPDCLRLLKPEGILLTDNVYFRGMVTGEVPTTKRFKTIVKRLQEYLAVLTSHSLLKTVVLPLGDGVAISYKKGEEDDEF